MTDFEVVMAFTENANSSQNSYMNFVTIVFAFIVAGYLVAAKLSQKMTILVTVLFTVVAIQESLSTTLFLIDYLGLIPEIQSRVALQFHAANNIGDFITPVLVAIHVATQILAYAGSIIFFFHQRREGLMAQPGSG